MFILKIQFDLEKIIISPHSKTNSIDLFEIDYYSNEWNKNDLFDTDEIDYLDDYFSDDSYWGIFDKKVEKAMIKKYGYFDLDERLIETVLYYLDKHDDTVVDRINNYLDT